MDRRSLTIDEATSVVGLDALKPLFSSPNVHFLTLKTLKGPKDRFQSISKVSDHLRKVSKTFFLVREKNKKDEGFHFHALLLLPKKPSKGWYRKGVYTHLQKVGRRARCPSGLSVGPPDDMGWDLPEVQEILSEEALDRVIQTAVVRSSVEKSVGRLFSYMMKEFHPERYVGYVLVCRGKSKAFTRTLSAHQPAPPAGGGEGRDSP